VTFTGSDGIAPSASATKTLIIGGPTDTIYFDALTGVSFTYFFTSAPSASDMFDWPSGAGSPAPILSGTDPVQGGTCGTGGTATVSSGDQVWVAGSNAC